jgi:hypothetical protein
MSSTESDPRNASPPQAASTPAGRSGPAELSGIAWRPKHDLNEAEWSAAGRRLGWIGRGSQWWIGDWLRYGNRKWGETYPRAARITGYDVASLRNMAWIASQFDVSLRNDRLTWSHHALLASLETAEKQHWLNESVARRLSVADLRVALRSRRIDEEAAPRLSSDARAAPNSRLLPSPVSVSTSPVRSRDIVCPACGHIWMIMD